MTSYVLVGAGFALALVFALSAVAKLRDFGGFVAGGGPLALVPAARRRPVAGAVVVAETALAVGLPVTTALTAYDVTRPAPRLALGLVLAATAMLLAGFTVAIGLSLRRGHREACRCFGANATPLGAVHVVRNGVLLVVAGAGLLAATDGAGGSGAGALLAGAAGLVTGLLLTRFEDLADLAR